MSETQHENPGDRARGGDDDRRSGSERDGSIPFLEELFRGDGDAPEAVRRRR